MRLVCCHHFSLLELQPTAESEAHGQDCQYWLGLMLLFMLFIGSSVAFDKGTDYGTKRPEPIYL
jgi:hypothetical protein